MHFLYSVFWRRVHGVLGIGERRPLTEWIREVLFIRLCGSMECQYVCQKSWHHARNWFLLVLSPFDMSLKWPHQSRFPSGTLWPFHVRVVNGFRMGKNERLEWFHKFCLAYCWGFNSNILWSHGPHGNLLRSGHFREPAPEASFWGQVVNGLKTVEIISWSDFTNSDSSIVQFCGKMYTLSRIRNIVPAIRIHGYKIRC